MSSSAASDQELDNGVVYEMGTSRELQAETVARLAIVALNGQKVAVTIELIIEGREAARVRLMKQLVRESLANAGYNFDDLINQAEAEVLEEIAGLNGI